MFELKKIGFIKRASALLLDAVLLAVLSTGFIWIISLICGYGAATEKGREYLNQRDEYRQEYFAEIANKYGFIYEEAEDGKSYTIKTQEGNAASEDDLLNALGNDENRADDARMKEAFEAFYKISVKIHTQQRLVHNMLFMMVSIGVLLSYLILEFILPIILKNGQTVGKKVFSICLVRPNCVKITILSLFARTLLGKFAIETMFPILLVFLFLFRGLGWLAIVLLAAITLLNVIVFFATKNRTPIHDLIAGTVVADMKLQMIYASEEELAAKKAAHKEFLPSGKS